LQEKRAIVTSIPGTTRDVIEEIVNIRGLPVKLLDTAGIRDTEDEIEQEGMKMTLEKIPLADLILFVVDASRPFNNEDTLIMQAVSSRACIVVRNKSDLPSVAQLPDTMNSVKTVSVSARVGDGIDELREAIYSQFIRGGVLDGREFTALSQARHRDSLEKARKKLVSFLESFSNEPGLEFVALDLRDALRSLGEVTGETTPDDILDLIFSRFCIGK
jgi:tRNA modification GTPase